MWSAEQILFAIVAILLAYYLYFEYDPRYFTRMRVKGPFPLPFMGNMLAFLREGFLRYSVYIRRKYGRVAGVFEGTVPVLLISDPDLIQQLLIKDFNTFPNRRVINPGDGVTDLFLTALQDDHWRHVRHITSPAYSTGKLKQMMSDINDCAKLLENNLRNQAKCGEKVVNMKDCCGQFTMDVIARTGFGMEVDTQKNPNSPFVVHAKKMFEIKLFNPGAIIFFFFPVFRPLLRRVGFSLFPQDSIGFFRDVALKALDRKEEEQRGDRVDFLQLMVKARNEHKASETQTADKSTETPTTTIRKGLTEDEAVAQAVLFLLAGYETTASTLSFVLYNLALYPECQEKLYDEVINVVGDKTEIDFETANSFTYMDQCIQETLRLYPPFPRTDRQAVADTMLGDLQIRKGQFVAVQIHALHHDPDIWPEPETFDPDRFSAEAVASHHPCQYLPFSLGPRMCVGMRLAQVELRVALAHLIKHFRFTRCPETEVPLAFRPVGLLQTKRPIRLKVELRA